MKTILAMACAGWFASRGIQPPNTVPLAFGMTPQEVANVLQAPLISVARIRKDEIFYARYSAAVPGLHPIDEEIYLKFHNGCLTGWKKDWRMTPRGAS